MFTTPNEELVNEFVNGVMAADQAAIGECAAWYMSADLEPQLEDIKAPTLIVAGAKDMIPVDLLRRNADAIKGCRFELWEDDGHALPMESPQKVVDLLTSFIVSIG
jgi:pimeloyl-ACP methyl ester carboxylesterase